MSDQFELHIGGFKTKAQVEEFLNWYEGQGEQDAAVWFECRDNLDGVDFMPVDMKVKPTWVGKALIARLKID